MAISSLCTMHLYLLTVQFWCALHRCIWWMYWSWPSWPVKVWIDLYIKNKKRSEISKLFSLSLSPHTHTHTGKSDEETLEELSSRATSRMMSGASRRSRAPTAMGVSAIPEEGSTMPGIIMLQNVYSGPVNFYSGTAHYIPDNHWTCLD